MSKGFDFERKMCKRLSRWWSNDSDPDIFWRTEGSGGRATSANRESLENYGDMKADKPEGQPAIDFALWEFKKGFTSMGRVKPGSLAELNYDVQQMGLKAFVKKKGKGNSPFMSKISGFIGKLKKAGKFDIIDFIDSISEKDPLFWTWWLEAERDRKETKRPWSIIVIQRDGKKPIVAIKSDLHDSLAQIKLVLSHPTITLWFKETLIYFMDFEIFFNEYLTPKNLRTLLAVHKTNKPKKLKRRRKDK